MDKLQLNYEVNGRKYLLMDVVVTESTKNSREAAIRAYECIQQGVKQIRPGGFFSNTYAVISVLCPEEHALEFSNRI